MKTLLLSKSGPTLCGLLLISWIQISTLWAFDREELLPPAIWRIKTQLQITPAYKKALGNSGKRIPLQDLLIRDRLLRGKIKGELTREERKIKLEVLYGFSEKWLFSGSIPFLQRKQTANLTFHEEPSKTNKALVAKAQKIQENLKSEEVQGIGDLAFHTFYVFNYTSAHLFRGGLGLKLPTGTTGTPRGIYPLAIGDRQIDLSGVLYYTFYPAIEGLRHDIRGELIYNLVGIRETLEGEEGDYYGGTLFDTDYTLGYEQNNWLFESQFQHRVGTGTTIKGQSLNDQMFVNTLSLSLGYGNLSDLEKSPLPHPYHFRIRYETFLQGKNVPLTPNWQLLGLFYF